MSQTLHGYVLIQISHLITPTSDVAVTTDIVSVSYTDIIVSPTTDSSTVAQAVTILSQVSQTQTETIYSATVVKATTATALTDGSSATSLMRRRSENQGDCKPTQSRTSSLSLSSISALFSITSNRPSHKDYSSVCTSITVMVTT